jgi:hypothetical protein
MIPLPELAVEFILGLGAALFGANLWVLVRPMVARARGWPPAPRPPSTTRAVVNLIVGGGVALWALATLVAR